MTRADDNPAAELWLQDLLPADRSYPANRDDLAGLGLTGAPIGCYLAPIMTKPGWQLLTIALAAYTFLALPAAAHCDVDLLRVGDWHSDEVDSPSSDGWHCVVETAVGFELRGCSIEVTTVFDIVVNANTGKRVEVPGLEAVAFLIRGEGANGLEPGLVLTVFAGEYPFERGAALPLGREDRRSFLIAEPAGEGYDVVLTEPGASQVLARGLGTDPDASPALLWAGDLDRDGRLDYLLDATDHYNVTEWVLFLSRGAGEGKLVRRAAVFRTTGC